LSRDLLIENPKDGTLLVLIPEGEFLAGKTKFPVRLPAFYLALHPVTNGQYQRFVEESVHHTEWKPAAAPEHPAVNVSWDDAQQYCRWAGLRLPTELEWEKGARWVDGREYPWGEEWEEGKCRNSKNRGSEQGGVWSYAEGSSGWGPYQMSGNVWEWCEDWYESKAYERYKQRDLSQPGKGSGRVLRGGSWCSDYPAPSAARFDATPLLQAGTSASASGAPGLKLPFAALPFYPLPGERSEPGRNSLERG